MKMENEAQDPKKSSLNTMKLFLFGSKKQTISTSPALEKIQQETLESSKRCLRLLGEMQQMGIETYEDLLTQGEQLERIDEKLTDIDETLDEAEKILSKMKHPWLHWFFGGLLNLIFLPYNQSLVLIQETRNTLQQTRKKINERRIGTQPGYSEKTHQIQMQAIPPENEKKQSRWIYTTKSELHDELDLKSAETSPNASPSPSTEKGSAVSKLKLFEDPKLQENQDQLDQNLNLMIHMLEQLKQQAVQIGEVLETQNPTLDDLIEKVPATTHRVKKDTRITNSI